jgi:hypothetical protein
MAFDMSDISAADFGRTHAAAVDMRKAGKSKTTAKSGDLLTTRVRRPESGRNE